ncbi:MAG: GlxA family transcriptional regulator [Gammaproteobacteria bacterium]|nr:GlxA family transcriptional regulator [Gammaproteobacteria bacterium]
MYRLALVLLPDYSHLELAAAVEPLFVANWLAQQAVFAWSLVSVDGAAVRASNGMLVPVDGALAAADDCASVFVLASFDAPPMARDPRLLRWLKRRARAGVEIGGLENGTLALAEAGLLDGQRVAVHWDNVIGFAERHTRTRPVAQLFARGAQRISCAGGAAVLDLMIEWIAWRGHSELASEVAQHLLLAPLRRGEREQRAARAEPDLDRDPVVAHAVRIMRETFDAPLPCGELASRVGLSLRQLERRFRSALGSTLLKHYRQVRIAAAHQLLQQTELGVLEVAIACGFASTEYFSRLYRRQFHCSPSADRRQSTAAPVMRGSRQVGVARAPH